MAAGDKKPGKAQMGLGRSEMSVKARANANEQSIADILGGVRQPASGALPGRKGDVDVGSFVSLSTFYQRMSLFVKKCLSFRNGMMNANALDAQKPRDIGCRMTGLQ